MGLGIAIMIVVVYLFWKVEKGVNKLKNNINEKISSFWDFESGFKCVLHVFDWLKSRKKKD